MGMGEWFRKVRMGEENYNLALRVDSQKANLEKLIAAYDARDGSAPKVFSAGSQLVDPSDYRRMRLAVLTYWSGVAKSANPDKPLKPLMSYVAGKREGCPSYFEKDGYATLSREVAGILGLSDYSVAREYIAEITLSALEGYGKLPKADS